MRKFGLAVQVVIGVLLAMMVVSIFMLVQMMQFVCHS